MSALRGQFERSVCVCSFGPTSLRVLALLRFVSLPQIRQHMGKEVTGREAAPSMLAINIGAIVDQLPWAAESESESESKLNCCATCALP